jgi:hypothetical protein
VFVQELEAMIISLRSGDKDKSLKVQYAQLKKKNEVCGQG